MSRWIGKTIVLSFFLVLLVGCKKQEDKLVEKKIELHGKMSEIWESVTDNASFADAATKVKPVMEEFNKVEEDLKNHPGQQAAAEAHQEQLNTARDRFNAAVQSAKKNRGKR
jgi:hypothetical protein